MEEGAKAVETAGEPLTPEQAAMLSLLEELAKIEGLDPSGEFTNELKFRFGWTATEIIEKARLGDTVRLPTPR